MQHCFSTRLAAVLQNKLDVFVLHFTIGSFGSLGVIRQYHYQYHFFSIALSAIHYDS